MKPNEYKTAWHMLKEDMLTDYVSTHKQVDKIKSRAGQYHDFQVANAMVSKNELHTWLMRMDYLDGTHEFSNLKHDLERGSE